MSNLVVEPCKLNGGIEVPPSKKLLEIALVCACFSKGVSEIRGINMSDNTRAFIDVFKKLGARISEEKDRLVIDGTDTFCTTEPEQLECFSNRVGEVIAFSAPSAYESLELIGRTRLFGIMLEDCCQILRQCEIDCEADETAITVSSGSVSGVIEINGKAPSRIISSLLLALPLYRGGARIKVTQPVDSKSLIDITIKIMKVFGVEVKNNNYHTFTVDGTAQYRCARYTVEGDYLYAAPFLTAGAIGNFVVCKNLDPESVQENREIVNIIRSFNGEVLFEGNSAAALPSKLRGCVIDAAKGASLLPYAALLAAFAKGETIIKNMNMLRNKKSEIVSEISSQLNSLGAMVMERNDELVIEGVDLLKGGTASACEDVSLAMMLLVASTRSENSVTIKNTDCLYQNSYRTDFENLGGRFVKPADLETE